MAKVKSKIHIAKLIIVLSCILIALNSLLLVYRGVAGYKEAIDKGQQNSEELVRIVADHVEQTFLAVDMVLKRAVEKQYFNQLFGNNLNDDMYNNFMAWANETPQISGMVMTDENGLIKLIYRKRGYETWMEGKETLEDKKLFYILKDSKDVDMFFDISNDKWISERGLVLMSRRINKIDGQFGGIMLALVDNKYLSEFFASLEKGRQTNMMLSYDLLGENQMLINQLDKNEENYVNKLINRIGMTKLTDINTIIKQKDQTGPFSIYSMRSIPNMSLVTAVVSYQGDIFQEWLTARIYDGVFMAILIVFGGVISFFAVVMSKQMDRVQKSERTAIMASQAKSEFLANMSHELRTPLNAIIGFSEMMNAGYFGQLNVKQKERINDVYMCGKHLLELINDILEFSKGEAGKMELRESNVDIQKVVSESIRMFNERAKTEGIKINSTIQDNLPLIRADDKKLKQILINLMSNSLKFTERGGNIHINCFIDSERSFVTTVSDTGIGIAEEDIPKALSVFGQISKHDVSEGGTGLGLPLCKMIAEMHGGKLKLESIEGVGTKVTVTLPSQRIVTTQLAATPALSSS